ncbi:MAG: glycosyltransferase family 39 protein [Novosphingobium sp.]|nr:glycosyltransferase family 39 protein [Novosphingobium sp.]
MGTAAPNQRADAAPGFRVWLAGIAAIGFVLRLGFRLAAGPAVFWATGYGFFWTLARSLASGHGYAFPGQPPTLFRVPGYPLFLALVSGGHADFLRIAMAQAALSTATAVLTGLYARRLFGSAAGLIAAGLAALYPYYIAHDTSLTELTLLGALTLAGLLAFDGALARRSVALAALAGVLLGAGVLTRQTLLPFAVVLAPWPAITLSRAERWRGIAMGLALLAATAAVCAPWLMRAHRLSGQWAFDSEGGAALYAGNHPRTFAFYPERSIDLSRAAIFASPSPEEARARAQLGPGSPALDRWYARRGLEAIASHPLRTLVYALRKNAAAFGPLPSPRHRLVDNLVHAFSYTPLLVLGIYGAWRERRRWRRLGSIWLLFACFIVTTGLIWAHSSHRSPLDVYLMVLASPVLATAARHARLRASAGECKGRRDDVVQA